MRLLALLLAFPAHAFETLQNDSAAPGGEIAFYPRLQSEESFRVILDAPEWPTYRICRLFLWIGPDDFNVFLIRIGEADDVGGERALIWQTDEEAYQIFGSRNSISAVDLRDFDIVTDARRLRVRFTHAPGFPAPPTIASDSDGITPGRNQIAFMMRNGNEFDDFTENLPEDGNNPRPPGDWILRAQVAELDEACPEGDGPGPVMDSGLEPPPVDQGLSRDAAADAGGPRDAGPVADARPPRPDARAEGDTRVDDPDADRRDGARPDAGEGPNPDRGTGSDRGLGAFALERISPVAGTPDRNVDVVVNGRGFPFGGAVRAFLGDTRLLEPQVLSESTITAIVPAGMDPGTYALRVERGDGQVAILPEAYQVLGPAAGTPATDDCGCRLAERDPPPLVFALLIMGLCLRRRRG